MAKKAYIGADGVARKVKKGYVGVDNATPVRKYQVLEYIEGTGAQYLDTGFKPNQNTRVVVDFENTGNYVSNAASVGALFGARNDASSAVFGFWIGENSYPHYGNVGYDANGSFSANINTRLTYELNRNVAKLGDQSINCMSATFTTSHSLYLFGVNNMGAVDDARKVAGKLWAATIYDNDTLVRDYVPCRRVDGSVGLYDRVHKRFYGNSGTGFFMAGAETGEKIDDWLPDGYTQVPYIESTGTQYIDTGVTVKSSLVSQLKFNMTALAGGVIYGSFPDDDLNDYRLFNYQGECNLDLPGGSGELGNRISGGTMVAGNDYEVEVGNFYVKDLATGSDIVSGSAVSFPEQANTMKMWGGNSSVISCSSGRLYYLKIYDNGTLVRDYVPCTNSEGTAGLYDLANDVFYTNDGTGEFVVGTGKARKIKKAYIGIGGVARPCWSSGWEYWGTTKEGLQIGRNYACSANVGDYLLFGASHEYKPSSTDRSKYVDAYNSELTHFVPATLGQNYMANSDSGVNNDNYAMFGTGCGEYGNPFTTNVFYYNADLTRQTAALNTATLGSSSGKFGQYALYVGGLLTNSTATKRVEGFNGAMSKVTTSLSVARAASACAETPNHFVVVGGATNSGYSVYTAAVDSFNTSLTRTTLASIPEARLHIGYTKTPNKAVFLGGFNGSTWPSSGYAYDDNLTRTDVACWGHNRFEVIKEGYGGLAVGASRYVDSNGVHIIAFEWFTDDLVRREARLYNSAAATYSAAMGAVGDFVIRAGGGGGDMVSEWVTAVDAYVYY